MLLLQYAYLPSARACLGVYPYDYATNYTHSGSFFFKLSIVPPIQDSIPVVEDKNTSDPTFECICERSNLDIGQAH